jgi:catechol 2,3-dioxygenase-like lactoylglutathione lyase family enzyme
MVPIGFSLTNESGVIHMIGYVTLGTNDLPRATGYYDVLLGLFGAKRGWETEKFIAWTTGPGAPMLIIIKPNDGKPATVGNGTMVALAATSKEQVNAVHAKALSLGSKDEGAVGPRGDNFYAGYFRDLDGNKLCVFFMG